MYDGNESTGFLKSVTGEVVMFAQSVVRRLFSFLYAPAMLLLLSSCSLFNSAETDQSFENTQISSVTQNTSPTEKTSSAHFIALLLPQEDSGLFNAGNAVQAGFMADYKNTSPLPTIKIYNQDDFNQAVQDGADYIVGPLDKNKVTELQQQSNIASLPIVSIALNTPDNPKTIPNMVLFSLSPTDEAVQIADKAFQDGHHNALLITPKGEWGQNIANALQKRWESRGGSITGTLSVNSLNSINTQIQQLLDAHKNNSDVVFLITQPQVARQIKPLLNYYHADTLPVYSTSLVYSGLVDTQKDSALNGIIFCDMPLVLDKSSPWATTRGDMIASQPLAVQKYSRLYALGWDAAYLTKHFDQLHSGIYGATGKLSLSSQHQILRTLTFAVFKNGQPEPLS